MTVEIFNGKIEKSVITCFGEKSKLTDTITIIPLICTALVVAFLFVLLVIIKIRNTAKVSFISYLALLVLAFACVRTIVRSDAMFFYLLVLLACVLLVPYCVMLAFGKPKEIFVSEDELDEEEIDEAPQQMVVQEIQEDEFSLLEKGKEFVSLAANSFLVKGEKEANATQPLLDAINKACVEATDADGGAVLLVDDFDDVITVKSFQGEFPPPYKLPDDLPHKPLRVSTSFKYAQFPLRDNIFGEVASTGKSELIVAPKIDDRIYQNESEDFLKLGSFIFIPLKIRDKEIVVGLVALSRNFGNEPFSEKEFEYAKTLTGFAEDALKSVISFKQYKEQQELTKESDIASEIQLSLLPKKLPPLAGLSVGSFSEHTAGVCSDSFDVITARQDRTSFVLVDVAGKGMNSLLVITMLRAMFRLIVNTTQTAGTILSWANRGICAETNLDHFASVALINYDPTKRKIQLSTGGSIPVMRFNAAKGELENISIMSEPIGVEKSKSYKDIEFTANRGDILITYTDGLVESLNSQGKPYNISNIETIIKANSALSGREIANLVKSDVKKFIGTAMLHDDQTLLVVKIQ